MGAWRIGKSKLPVGASVPVYGGGVLNKHEVEGRDEDETSDPSGLDIDWKEYTDEPTHRHFGHPEDHPIRLRHRKTSTDHLHGDEDKLVDQYKELASKAKSGGCTPEEIKLLRTVKGRMMQLNASRVKDARQVMLGSEMMNDGMAPTQGQVSAAFTSYSGPHRHQLGIDTSRVG